MDLGVTSIHLGEDVPIREGLSTKFKDGSGTVSSVGESHFKSSNLTPDSGGVTPFILPLITKHQAPTTAVEQLRRIHCKAGHCTCPGNRGVSVKGHAGTKTPKPSSHANSNLIHSTRV